MAQYTGNELIELTDDELKAVAGGYYFSVGSVINVAGGNASYSFNNSGNYSGNISNSGNYSGNVSNSFNELF
jgi:hypothetical protein